VQSRLTAVREQLRQLGEELKASPKRLRTLVGLVSSLEEEEEKLEADLLAARAAAALAAKDALAQTQSLAAALAAAGNSPTARLSLQSALRKAVTGIYCLSARDGMRSAVFAQIHFRDSDAIRTVVVYHRPELTNVAGRIPEFTSQPKTDKRSAWAKTDITIPSHRERVQESLTRDVSAVEWKRKIEPERPTPTEAARDRGRRQSQKRSRRRDG
jgi:hypothetical protein